MNELLAILIVVALFAVRFAVPLGLTMGICKLMNRWVAGCGEDADLATT